MCQIIVKVNKDKDVNEGRCRNGRGNYAGKLFDFFVRVVLKTFQWLNTFYVACLKVVMCFDFALCGFIVFMVYWAIAYSELFQTTKVNLSLKIAGLC